MKASSHLIVLVNRPHSTFALLLSNDLAGVLHNDLVRLEGAIATNPISAIRGLNDLYTDVVFASCLDALLQFLETAIPAVRAKATVGVITFVEHVPILAVLIATSLFGTRAGRQLYRLVFPPETCSIAHKHI